MRTRSNFYPSNSTANIPRHSNRRHIPNIVEPEIRTIAEIVAMADRTTKELLQAPRKANKFHGRENDNPYTHISNFKRMTATLKYRDVPNDAIKLIPYSLEDRARIWYEKEPPNSILTWDDLVNKFVNQFFPPSKTTHLKNEISRFTQRFEETFSEAWDCFKELLRACPHHGFSELTQIDTFYNGLTEQDQDSLNAASGGNLLNKTTREALKIIENKSKVRYSRIKSNVSRVNTSSRDDVSKTDDRIDKLADQISNLVEIVNKRVIAPTKAIEKTCVTYGGAHAYYECIAIDTNPSSVCTATGSYNQVSLPNRASHQIPPPGFAPVQNNPNSDSKYSLSKFFSKVMKLTYSWCVPLVQLLLHSVFSSLLLSTPTKTKSKDKGKGIMVEEPKPLKKKQQVELDEVYARKLHEELNQDIDWEVAMDHVKQKSKENPYVQRYQTMKKRPRTEAQARRNMMMYLKNTGGSRLDYFK
nr:hypothetical protein [Tanacetum cinerariifolium]